MTITDEMDIAGLIERARTDFYVGGYKIVQELWIALRALALENERMLERIRKINNVNTQLTENNSAYTDRIEELESERDATAKDLHIRTIERDRMIQCVIEVKAERDAIRLKTIEECEALAADRAETWHTEARRIAARDLRDQIRALGQSEKGEGKEEET